MIDERGWRSSAALAVVLVGGLSLPAVAYAQEHEHRSPYAGHEDRGIEALSPDDVEALLAGEGMGLALAAELNGYPGPRHVLDMAEELELTDEQRAGARRVFEVMQARAQALGGIVVDLERELDRLFATGEATPDEVRDLVERIGERRAHLRDVHLQAHLQLRPLLTEEQRERYLRLRGYGTGGSEGG